MKKLNILLADDHSVVRAGLKTILNLEKDFRVVGDAENGVEAGKLAKELQPDVVVMDLMMPDMSCGEAVRLVLKVSPESKVIVLTSYGTSSEIRVALDAGAISAVTKNISNRELTDALRRTAAGERILSPEIDGALSESEKDIHLTERQMAIVDSITRGFSNGDIAIQLGISRTRVKQHLTEVFAVLGAANRAEVAALAMRRNLLKI
ncbi:MAG: response regulator transcription factor [Paludibacteraceae bacterium]|nr:response regulator transcription factor [Paludibacteraceae bacterium]